MRLKDLNADIACPTPEKNILRTVPRLSCEKVETISRPLRIPLEVYEVAKEANELEASLRPVNSILVEAITMGRECAVAFIGNPTENPQKRPSKNTHSTP